MKKIAFSISLVVGFLLFAFAILQAGIDNVVKAILLFPAHIIIIAFFVNFIAVCGIGSLRWKIIIKSQNHREISFLKVFKAKLAGFSISYITPSILIGGEPVRAYILKEESNYGWEKSFASVIIDEAIYFFTLFLFMTIGFLFLADHFSLPRSISYGFWIIIGSSTTVLYLFYLRLANQDSNKEGFFKFLIKTLRLDRIKYIKDREENIDRTEKIILDFFKNKKRTFVEAFFLAIAEVILYLVVILIIVFYLNKTINAFYSISILSILTLANFVPIPGSLGSFEALLTFVFDLLGLGRSSGFAFSLIFRLINVAIVFVGFLALLYFELRTVANNFSLEAPETLLNIHRFLAKMLQKK